MLQTLYSFSHTLFFSSWLFSTRSIKPAIAFGLGEQNCKETQIYIRQHAGIKSKEHVSLGDLCAEVRVEGWDLWRQRVIIPMKLSLGKLSALV